MRGYVLTEIYEQQVVSPNSTLGAIRQMLRREGGGSLLAYGREGERVRVHVGSILVF